MNTQEQLVNIQKQLAKTNSKSFGMVKFMDEVYVEYFEVNTVITEAWFDAFDVAKEISNFSDEQEMHNGLPVVNVMDYNFFHGFTILYNKIRTNSEPSFMSRDISNSPTKALADVVAYLEAAKMLVRLPLMNEVMNPAFFSKKLCWKLCSQTVDVKQMASFEIRYRMTEKAADYITERHFSKLGAKLQPKTKFSTVMSYDKIVDEKFKKALVFYGIDFVELNIPKHKHVESLVLASSHINNWKIIINTTTNTVHGVQPNIFPLIQNPNGAANLLYVIWDSTFTLPKNLKGTKIAKFNHIELWNSKA